MRKTTRRLSNSACSSQATICQCGAPRHRKAPAGQDIRHNTLEGFVRKEECFGEASSRLADLLGSLERLRPGQAYGRGRNGEVAKKAKELCAEIVRICGGVIGD